MQAEFVLGKWLPSETPVVKAKIDKCVEVIENFAVMGLADTMTKYNSMAILPK